MNEKPYLIIVTGRPGSGKTTFSKKFGNEIFMPVISRDEIKEGYVHTFGKRHTELPQESNKMATEIFLNTLKVLIDSHVSVIAEAAFQHGMWAHLLREFTETARIYVFICKVDERVALDRFIRRGMDNPLREYFHGDKGVDMYRKGIELRISPYEEPCLDVPTLHIDTTGDYSPSIMEIRASIWGRNCAK